MTREHYTVDINENGTFLFFHFRTFFPFPFFPPEGCEGPSPQTWFWWKWNLIDLGGQPSVGELLDFVGKVTLIGTEYYWWWMWWGWWGNLACDWLWILISALTTKLLGNVLGGKLFVLSHQQLHWFVWWEKKNCKTIWNQQITTIINESGRGSAHFFHTKSIK